jgi:hypothetical protein
MLQDPIVIRSPGLLALAAETVWDVGDALESEFDALVLDEVTRASGEHAYSFAEQYGGQLVQRLQPEPGRAAEASSRGRISLPPHTDDAFMGSEARPEHIAVVGVHDPARVATTVVDLAGVLELLDPGTIDVLSQPAWVSPIGASFELESRHSASTPRPILSLDSDGKRRMALSPSSPSMFRSPNSGAIHIARLRAAIAQAPRIDVHLEPGEILLISNSQCLHGRGAVLSTRAVRRVYCRADLTALDAIASTNAQHVYSARSVLAFERRSPPTW